MNGYLGGKTKIDEKDMIAAVCSCGNGSTQSIGHMIIHGRIQGGPGGLDTPLFSPLCIGFLTLAPKLDPLLDPPPSCVCIDLRWTPPPFQKSWIRPCPIYIYIFAWPLRSCRLQISSAVKKANATVMDQVLYI